MLAEDQDLDDQSLLSRTAAGDMDAMKVLYQRHAQAVQRFVQTRIRDHFEVSDIVHNTMLDVWRTAGRFEGRSNARSWILSIARNKMVDFIRKQSRTELAEPDQNAPDESPNAEAVITASQDAAHVRECVDKLPTQQRSAIHLAFFEEMTYGEIAEVNNVPEGTIKTRIYHAKKLLMRCLSMLRGSGV